MVTFPTHIKLPLDKDINVPTKATVLGVFDYRSFLNIGLFLPQLTTHQQSERIYTFAIDYDVWLQKQR